jgi:WD40 repeat protein
MGFFDLNPLSPLAANVFLTAAARPFVLNLVDAQTGHLRHNLLRCPFGNGFNASPSLVSVAFSGDGSRLAACDGAPVVHVWETATGQEIATYQGHDKFPFLLALSPDGLLAATSSGQQVHVWETSTGRGIRVIPVPGQIRQLNFTANGRSIRVFAANMEPGEQSWSAAVFAYAAATGKEESRFLAPAGTHPDWGVFSRDGKLLALATRDLHEGFSLVEVPTGRVRHVWHDTVAMSLAFSPDGLRLVSVEYQSNGWVPKIWDTDTGHEILTLPRGQGGSRLRFTADGHRLVETSGGSLQVWDATPLEAPKP